ncbi:hypothetical protein SAMN05878503_10711 [Cereibacter ovatus]|uniref:Phosphoadenosine phosphosulfate reductase n=2 Tax=Cereibacter ovatus TaxID=439529 RepID=A0A285CTE1_9RHOB|nr:hypothetical protein SAMN05878503_10711 [Cereibacter ovatus]
MFEPSQDDAAGLSDPFADVAAQARATGGFFHDLGHHAVAHLPIGAPRLVLSFDNLASRREAGSRFPWGHAALAAMGWDVLGIMVRRPDWFREAALWDLMDSLRDEGFFARYGAVATYGASMGGYGAAVFAPMAPGCTVLAFAPQSTLNPALAPFETRYRYGRGLGDWDDPRSDAAEAIRAAGRAYVAADPLVPEDACHLRRLDGANVLRLEMPGLGHKMPPALRKMNILKPLVAAALSGDLDAARFHSLYRARRQSVPWLVSMLERARQKGHVALALRAAEREYAARPHWRLRAQRNALRTAAADQ